jgi:hypothetical protein
MAERYGDASAGLPGARPSVFACLVTFCNGLQTYETHWADGAAQGGTNEPSISARGGTGRHERALYFRTWRHRTARTSPLFPHVAAREGTRRHQSARAERGSGPRGRIARGSSNAPSELNPRSPGLTRGKGAALGPRVHGKRPEMTQRDRQENPTSEAFHPCFRWQRSRGQRTHNLLVWSSSSSAPSNEGD